VVVARVGLEVCPVLPVRASLRKEPSRLRPIDFRLDRAERALRVMVAAAAVEALEPLLLAGPVETARR
jgi:hypothetical protein